MAERNKLSMLKAVQKDLKEGLAKLSFSDFENFGNLLKSISQIYGNVEDDRLDEAEDLKRKELEEIQAKKKAKAEKK